MEGWEKKTMGKTPRLVFIQHRLSTLCYVCMSDDDRNNTLGLTELAANSKSFLPYSNASSIRNLELELGHS